MSVAGISGAGVASARGSAVAVADMLLASAVGSGVRGRPLRVPDCGVDGGDELEAPSTDSGRFVWPSAVEAAGFPDTWVNPWRRCGGVVDIADLTGFRLESFHKLRDDVKNISHDPEVSDIEYRGALVLVDGDNDFRGLHPGKMLYCPGNTEGDVKLRRNRHPGLSDLEGMFGIARVHGRTRSTDSGTQSIGQGLDKLKRVFGAYSPAP